MNNYFLKLMFVVVLFLSPLKSFADTEQSTQQPLTAEQRALASKIANETIIEKLQTIEKSKKSISEYTIKPHHAQRQLTCTMCHGNSKPEEYKSLETKDCLDCHTSAEKIAQRTRFMDANLTNPHNSLHDKTNLACYECHKEHEKSQALCTICHDNTKDWFAPVP